MHSHRNNTSIEEKYPSNPLQGQSIKNSIKLPHIRSTTSMQSNPEFNPAAGMEMIKSMRKVAHETSLLPKKQDAKGKYKKIQDTEAKINKELYMNKLRMKKFLVKDSQQGQDYYNKWYVPPDKRFFHQANEEKSIMDKIQNLQQAYLSDPLLIYNSLKVDNIQHFDDPFDLVPSKKALRRKEIRDTLDKIQDQFKSSKILLKYIEVLDKRKLRIPQFLQNLDLKK